MNVCTICEQPIEAGHSVKEIAHRDDWDRKLPSALSHKSCRRRSVTVPFVASWSSELIDDPVVVGRLLTGIGYADEIASDRDDRGVLRLRRLDRQGAAKPRHRHVHPDRQCRAMAELLCQVCGEPTDEDDRGRLWLLEDSRTEWAGWPHDLVTPHPPTCLPCVRKVREECPHMWRGSVAAQVGKSELCGVWGRRYTGSRLAPTPGEVGVVPVRGVVVKTCESMKLSPVAVVPSDLAVVRFVGGCEPGGSGDGGGCPMFRVDAGNDGVHRLLAEPRSAAELASPQAAPSLVPVHYPVTDGFDMAMPAAVASVRQARRVARVWCRHCRVPDDLIDSVLLIVSEMCASAILHGRADSIGVRAWLPSLGVLRIEVADYTPSQTPTVQPPSADSETGRGLLLVDVVASDAGGRWGFTADGSRAWCTLPLPTEAHCAQASGS
ncbi:ATP-binding protein [Streptomyces sp. NPDC001714]|uniref:ATP-binding protein n=1 Tax=Streptomyces sp. NPDC001714 TaxID=3364603 RepID=UPI00369A5403